MVALGAYLEIALQFRAIENGITGFALGPQTFGHIALVATFGAYSGGHQFLKPAHKVRLNPFWVLLGCLKKTYCPTPVVPAQEKQRID
jgi:hypothetical protein